MLKSTAAFVNCVGGVNGDNPTEITQSDVDAVVRTLLGNDAKKTTDNIQGEDRFGTGPVRDSYVALAHTDLSGDLSATAGFIHARNYPSQDGIPSAEWGTIGNLRFLLSSKGCKTNGVSNLNAAVYDIFCVGLEAYGIVDQDGLYAQLMYTPPMYSGPLWMNATIGWKTGFAARVLNDAWVIRLRATLRA